MTLDKLSQIIEQRKRTMPSDSYAASLFKDGRDRIIQKVGEEATEVVIAAKGKSRRRIISEVSDLFFHLLVLLSFFNISLNEIFSELERRNSS